MGHNSNININDNSYEDHSTDIMRIVAINLVPDRSYHDILCHHAGFLSSIVALLLTGNNGYIIGGGGDSNGRGITNAEKRGNVTPTTATNTTSIVPSRKCYIYCVDTVLALIS